MTATLFFKRLAGMTVARHPEPLQGSFDVLKGLSGQGGVGARRVSQGVMFHMDPKAQITGQWRADGKGRLRVTADHRAPADWFALHVALPELLSLSQLSHVGVLVRAASSAPCTLTLALRSGHRDTFHDAFFHATLDPKPAGTDYAGALTLAREPDVPQPADWRELVLFFPTSGDIDIAFDAFRIFAL